MSEKLEKNTWNQTTCGEGADVVLWAATGNWTAKAAKLAKAIAK